MLQTRTQLAKKALDATVAARSSAKAHMSAPVSPFDLCENIEICVRFVEISMEGMYVGGETPQILVSALRPHGRAAFTCAHELGHHMFGHGTSLDNLLEESEARVRPDAEFLADAFAGFLLMPTLGIKRALTRRGWSAATLTAHQAFVLACHFGVGYETLIFHMNRAAGMLTDGQVRVLRRQSPKSIRDAYLGTSTDDLVIADLLWEMPTIDVETGTCLQLPPGVEALGSILSFEREMPSGRLYKVLTPGICQARNEDASWAKFIRSSRRNYVGLARYRHLEGFDDED